MSGARGTARDAKHKNRAEAEPAEDPTELLVVSMTRDKLEAAVRKLEDWLLACVDNVIAGQPAANLNDGIKLHQHLSKIGRRPGASNAQRQPRAAVPSRKESQEVSSHFAGGGAEP